MCTCDSFQRIVGGISKQDLRSFLKWASTHLGYNTLVEVEAAPPTAELEPLGSSGDIVQTDEVDMGMTYEELSIFGRLRKVHMCGPVSMYRTLVGMWRGIHAPEIIADKVKHFFKQYSINRHKVTVLTPSYHAENYSPDDNRFDHRQFLYNVVWPWQFKKIDEVARQLDEKE
jgi:NAD+ synthase (glutamine-hydrolysing)